MEGELCLRRPILPCLINKKLPVVKRMPSTPLLSFSPSGPLNHQAKAPAFRKNNYP